MKMKASLFIALILAFGVFSECSAAGNPDDFANQSFSDVGAGANGGYTVTEPAAFEVNEAVSTRYLRVEVKNDGTLGNESYIELRSLKAWAGGSENVLNGVFTGGSAQVIGITGYYGADPYQDDLMADCSDDWQPQGSLCDESPNTNSKTISYKSNSKSGATWSVREGDEADGVGMLVIDMGSVQDLTELRVFQMFSDGKTTQVRFSQHPETEDAGIGAFDSAWDDFEIKKIVADVDESEDDADVEKKGDSAQYKHYKKEYKNHDTKRTHQKIKHLKKGDDAEFAYYQNLKMNYKKYDHLSKRERKQILTEQEFEDFETYKDYRGYKKYKELKKKR